VRSVDTNVLVRLVARDDPGQTAAAEEFTAGGAWISLLVLMEFSWVLSTVYERTPADIARAVEMLLDHGQLVVQEPEVVSGALVHFRKRPALGFSDCLVLEISRKAGHVPLGTLDRALAKLPDAEGL
jgi:predicted nucleic-acid-binding protein